MKKIGVIIILYVTTIVFMLFIGQFFKDFISQYYSELHSNYITGFIFRGVLIVFSLFLLKKLNLVTFSGLNKPFKFSHPTALIVPLVIIGTTIVSKMDLYLVVKRFDLLMFLFSVIVVGIFEEISMRGIVLPLFLKLFNFKNKSFYIGVIFSSLIFAVLHYMNICTKEDYGFDIASSQVFAAFCIGIYFCGLFLRTGNIISSILIHSAFNFAFGTEILEEIRDGYKPPVGKEINSFMELVPTLIFWLLIITVGLLMVKFSNKESFVKRLEETSN